MTWGRKSRAEADTVHADVRLVAERVDSRWSSTVLQGKRTAAEQAANVAKKVSSTLKSKHLPEFSLEPEKGVDAMDVAPDPLRWPDMTSQLDKIEKLLEAIGRDGLDADDRKALRGTITKAFKAFAKDLGRWYAFAGYWHGVADEMFERGEISRKLEHGYDWDGDHDLNDQRLDDLPHHQAAS